MPGTPAQAHHLGTRAAPRRGRCGRGCSTRATANSRRPSPRCARTAAPSRSGARLRAPAPEPDLRLLVAALKRDALDWVVEKATELGVAAHPAGHHPAQRGGPREHRAPRRHRARAAEQCERLSVPARRRRRAAARRARRLGRRAAAGRRRAARRRADRATPPRRPAPALRLAGRARRAGSSGRNLTMLRRRAFVTAGRPRPPHPAGGDGGGGGPRRAAGTGGGLDRDLNAPRPAASRGRAACRIPARRIRRRSPRRASLPAGSPPAASRATPGASARSTRSSASAATTWRRRPTSRAASAPCSKGCRRSAGNRSSTAATRSG